MVSLNTRLWGSTVRTCRDSNWAGLGKVARGAHVETADSEQQLSIRNMSAMALRRAAWSVVLGVKCARLSPAFTVAIASPCRHHHCGGDMASWRLDSTVTERYMKLDQGNNVLATYLWIDGTGVVRGEGEKMEEGGEGGEGGGWRGWEGKGR